MPNRGRLSGMPGPDGFTYQQRANGDVVILHSGRAATTLRGARALEFLADVGGPPGDRKLMARVTGNYAATSGWPHSTHAIEVATARAARAPRAAHADGPAPSVGLGPELGERGHARRRVAEHPPVPLARQLADGGPEADGHLAAVVLTPHERVVGGDDRQPRLEPGGAEVFAPLDHGRLRRRTVERQDAAGHQLAGLAAVGLGQQLLAGRRGMPMASNSATQ